MAGKRVAWCEEITSLITLCSTYLILEYEYGGIAKSFVEAEAFVVLHFKRKSANFVTRNERCTDHDKGR